MLSLAHGLYYILLREVPALWTLSDREEHKPGEREERRESMVLGVGRGPRRQSFSSLHPNHCIDKEQHHDQKGHIGQGLEGSKYGL